MKIEYYDYGRKLKAPKRKPHMIVKLIKQKKFRVKAHWRRARWSGKPVWSWVRAHWRWR